MLFHFIFSAALNAYYAQMQMDSVGISCSSPARVSTTTTPAGLGQGQPHILRKAIRKRNKGDASSSITAMQQQQSDAAVSYAVL